MRSRYVKDLVLNIDPMYVENVIQEYLRSNNFNLTFEKGENYYKTGGVMLTLRGFKYFYQNGILHIEAWNGKIGKEMNIGDGKLLGAAAKIPYYNNILALQGILDKERQMQQQPYGQMQTPVYAQANAQMQAPVYAQTNGQMQAPVYAQTNGQIQAPVYAQTNGQVQAPVYTQTNGQMQAPVYAQTSGQMQAPVYAQQFANYNQPTSAVYEEINKANNRNALIAFWLSIGSLVLIFGSKYSLILNLASFTLATTYGLKSQKKGMAVAAIVINAIVFAITLVRILIYIFL